MSGQTITPALPSASTSTSKPTAAARTKLLLEGPVFPTLLRLAAPNVLNLLAFDGVDVVYAKSWGSYRHYGEPERDVRERQPYRENWIVDEAKMARTDEAIFMHCLPVRRNVIVTDAVIDGPNSVVIDEAENRLHVQKAIMTKLIT